MGLGNEGLSSHRRSRESAVHRFLSLVKLIMEEQWVTGIPMLNSDRDLNGVKIQKWWPRGWTYRSTGLSQKGFRMIAHSLRLMTSHLRRVNTTGSPIHAVCISFLLDFFLQYIFFLFFLYPVREKGKNLKALTAFLSPVPSESTSSISEPALLPDNRLPQNKWSC